MISSLRLLCDFPVGLRFLTSCLSSRSLPSLICGVYAVARVPRVGFMSPVRTALVRRKGRPAAGRAGRRGSLLKQAGKARWLTAGRTHRQSQSCAQSLSVTVSEASLERAQDVRPHQVPAAPPEGCSSKGEMEHAFAKL